MVKAPLPAPTSTRTNTEFKAKRVQDSMNMVTMALHNPPLPDSPMAVRTFLVCRMSRMTIVRVRMTLSDSEIEMYGMVDHSLPVGCEDWYMYMMPVARSVTSALSIVPSSWRT